jgi:hypothetical protein
MDVTWRNKTYEFTPRILIGAKDKERESDISANIYAFDTESVELSNRYEPQCFQISNDVGGESLVYLPPYAKGLELFLDYWVKHFSWFEFENRFAFMYGHNLMYDWLQLIKYFPDLISMARTGIGLDKDYEVYKKDYYVILKKNALFTGNAPHFTLKLGFSARDFVYLKFRDTFSFFPGALDKLGKQLKLPVLKLKRPDNLGKIDYRDMEPCEEKTAFEEYGKRDSLVTRLVGEQIRTLHTNSDMQRIRVSAPGFAINYLLHTIPEGTIIKTGTFEPLIMQLILDTYAGGRTGGIYHGEVENLAVLDFHSSYPASMDGLPSFSETMEYIQYPELENLTTEELLDIIEECHCFMRISGEETDSLYPALITNKNNKLTPVYGEFENLPTTGVEVYVGIKSGTLKVTKVHELVCLVEMQEPSCLPFRDFARNAYKRKSIAEKDTPEYTGAKLVLNSGYGKLIESRTETLVADDVRNLVLPYAKGMETEFGKMYYEEYIKSLNQESEKTFNEIYPDLVEDILNQFDENEVETATFGKLSLTKLNYGRYAIPAAASLTTATSRARLVAVMKILKAIYWDTDSVFIRNYVKEKVNELLKIATGWLPPYVLPLVVGDELGQLDAEIENASGYLAGTKRYYIDNDIHRNCINKNRCKGDIQEKCPDKKKCKYKKAVHGIPTAPYDKAAEMIQKLATGFNNEYEGRERPTGVKETKTVTEIGRFTKKEYESKFHLDDRLEWEEIDGGWKGTIKQIKCFT